jgi:hypothetical protein
MGDLEICDRLRLNVIASIDWENHNLAGDDNSLSLISAGVDYLFR